MLWPQPAIRPCLSRWLCSACSLTKTSLPQGLSGQATFRAAHRNRASPSSWISLAFGYCICGLLGVHLACVVVAWGLKDWFCLVSVIIDKDNFNNSLSIIFQFFSVTGLYLLFDFIAVSIWIWSLLLYHSIQLYFININDLWLETLEWDTITCHFVFWKTDFYYFGWQTLKLKCPYQ